MMHISMNRFDRYVQFDYEKRNYIVSFEIVTETWVFTDINRKSGFRGILHTLVVLKFVFS